MAGIDASTITSLGTWRLLMPLSELTRAYQEAAQDPEFLEELAALLGDYSGRPTPLTLPQFTVATLTTLPVLGACTNRPPPR